MFNFCSLLKNLKLSCILKPVKINLPLFSTVVSSNICMFLSQDKTMENKGKLILTEIFPSVQKHDI